MNAAFVERWHEIEPLLDQVFDVPPEQRAVWLQRHCSDATLRALIGSALDGEHCVESLDRGASHWIDGLGDEDDNGIVDVPLPTIDGYRVLAFVGAGGMASVFKAERQLPGGPQTVALKLLRVNVHDARERARFLREQRILARLQHAHIAQLLDAGFTPTGTPYLALEFVAGDNVLAHCDQRRIGLRARLALFADVCAAVEHAHQNLVVHRDLKPGNVLVGADGKVKLLDFGIAKLLAGDDDATHTEARRLTRFYAAPEQVAGAPATTANDVYALGVLLGELLCGRRHGNAGEGDGDVDLARAIDDALAAARGAGTAALKRQLRGDLGAIVRKAVQVDPVRRYASVMALREDIAAYLRGDAIQARPDALGYRLRKFAQRHTLGIAVAAILVAVLSGATVFSLREAATAHREAARAETQTRLAMDEASRANAVKAFLQGLFDSATPGTNTSENAQELLARGRERAEKDFATNPELRAEVLGLVGDLERRSGHADRARDPLEQAAALSTQVFGAGDRRTLHIETLLAKQADELGHYRDGTTRLQHAVDAYHASTQRESEDEVQALAWLGGLYQRIGDPVKAVALGAQALAIARRALPPDHPSRIEALTNLGWVQTEAGHAADAVPLLDEALARKRRLLGEQHADVADAMALLTSALFKLGRYAEAEQLMRDAVAIDAKAYARPHPRVAWHLNDLATALVLQDKLDAGADTYRQSLALDRALFPAGDLNGAVSLGNIARVRFDQGLYTEAEADMREAIAQKTHLLGADYRDSNDDYDKANLARILIPLTRFDEAQALLDAALADGRKRRGERHVDIAFALFVQAQLNAARGDHTRAVASARESVTMYGALLPPTHAKAIAARLALGEELDTTREFAQAQTVFAAVLADVRATSPPIPSTLARALVDLAQTDDALGLVADAHKLRIEARASEAAIPPGRNVEHERIKRLLAAVP
jgi:tetratricopeptide (TPR) repeat protein